MKEYLLRIREVKRRVEILQHRIEVNDTDELQKALRDSEQELKCVTVEVMDLIGHLQDINQQVVMIRRYVDLQSWEEIAAGMAMNVRVVQKIHGRSLPLLERILSSAR